METKDYNTNSNNTPNTASTPLTGIIVMVNSNGHSTYHGITDFVDSNEYAIRRYLKQKDNQLIDSMRKERTELLARVKGIEQDILGMGASIEAPVHEEQIF